MTSRSFAPPVLALLCGAVGACSSDDDATPAEAAVTIDSPTGDTTGPASFAANVVAAIDTRDEDAFRDLVDGATIVNYFTTTDLEQIVGLFDWMDIIDLRLDGELDCEERTRSAQCFIEQTTLLEDIDGVDHPAARVDVTFRDGQLWSLDILPPRTQQSMHDILGTFQQFVEERAPGDLEVMYRDTMKREPNTTDEALELWQHHVDAYVDGYTPDTSGEPSGEEAAGL